MFNRGKSLLILLFSLFLLVGCPLKKASVPPVSDITVTNQTITLGKTKQLSINVVQHFRHKKITLVANTACKEIMTVEMWFQYSYGDDWRFRGSMVDSGLDLRELLKKTKEMIIHECTDLDAIRLVEPSNVHRDYIPYEGTYAKANNWALKDGFTMHAFSSDHVFDVNIKTLKGLKLSYSGICRQNQVVQLTSAGNGGKSGFYNIDPAYLPTKPDMKVIIDDFIEAYTKECPSVNGFEFRLVAMPNGYRCAKPAGPCSITTGGSANSILSQLDSTLEKIPAEKEVVILSHQEIFALLKNGDLVSIPMSTEFRELYIMFLESYSKQCRSSIENPIVRGFQKVEERTWPSGSTSKVNIGEPLIFYIEKKYVDKYDTYHRVNKMVGVLDMLGRYIYSGSKAIYDYASDSMKLRATLPKFIDDDGCDGKDVGTIKRNLYIRSSQ